MWPSWTESIQKRVCRYLLQRYLGQYFQEKLTLDQLNVDVLNGTGNVNDVVLDSQALNQLAEQHTIPMEFIEGHLDSISVSIPWKAIMHDSCEIEVTGLNMTIQPKKRVENAGSSMLDSMWTSMASSMQLAEECLKSEDVGDEPDFSSQEPLSGLEHCAQTIDAILSRVKMCFRDTIIRVEKSRSGSDVGIAMEVHIKLWRFCDESSNDSEDVNSFDTAFTHKRIYIEGMTLYTDLFRISPFSGHCEESNYKSAMEDPEKPDNLIMIGKIAGRHEIKLSVKKDDSIGGPQVIIDCSFGSLIGFLSPVQFHIIMELIKEFVNPDSNSIDEVRKKSYKEKPMDTFDFKRIEEELQEGLKPGLIGLTGLNQQRGWSSPVFADDSDDEFLPLKNNGACMYQSSSSTNFMNASMMTSMNLSMQQSMTESFASSTAKTIPSNSLGYRAGGHVISEQATSQTTKLSISFASLAIVLLHEDIITLSSTEAALPSSINEMREVAGSFFRQLGLFGASVKGKKDVQDVRTKLNEACTRNHHRAIVAPLKMEGVVSLVDLMSVFSGYVAIGYCEIIESLRDSKPLNGTPVPECIEVLVFPNSFEQGVAQSARIEFKNKSYKGQTKTALKIALSECQTEVDLSVCDRVNSLINSRLACYTESHVDQLRFENDPNHQKSNSQVSIKIACPKFSLNFRFPIPDMRPVDDNSRSPYWRRNLRNDSIILEMKEVSFSTVLNSNVEEFEFETQCHQARLYYKEAQTDSPILFATALSDDVEVDGESMRTQGFDWPRLVVSIYPKKLSTAVEAEISDEGESFDAFFTVKDKGVSPFSSRRVIHETLTAEEDHINASEESVIPGDRTEMAEFIEETSKSTMFRVILNLRSVEVQFPSKHFFEELYNRISTDLLLWEPCAPSVCTPSSPTRQFQGFKQPQSSAFTMCKSGQYDSGSDSEEELSTPAINSLKPRSGSFNRKITYGQSEVTLNITVKKAVCSMFTPFQDTTGNIVPEQRGQFTIKVEDGNFFMVSGFKGNTTLGYLCFHSEKGTLYHCDLVRDDDEMPSLKPSVMKTIYPSEEGVCSTPSPESSAGGYQDLLSVAVKIERDATTNVKNFKVALGIKGATLHHKLYLPNRTWFTQLTDFFDVVDTPVVGYTPSSVITELHLHLWSCAIDYRPLYLPYRCFLTMENFGISSNIAALTSTSVLRFISEDAALFLGTKTDSTDLKNDYVCVMDMDLFELSLRLCCNRNVPVPRVDLCASNNVLHIRTCSDSFKALTDVLTYYANEGDLMDPSSQNQHENEDRLPMNPIKECSSEPALINTEEISERERRMSVSQTEHLHDLVADAMEDTSDSLHRHSVKTVKQFHHKKPTKQSFEIHYTPGATGQQWEEDNRDSCTATPLPYDEPIMDSGGLPVDIPVSEDEDDEEFCILENDPGTGIVPKTGEPEARVLIDEPIRLVENHFSVPVGRMDILKAPKHYPNPIMKYSVHEMSLVWHLYGGEDFENTVPSKRPRVGAEERGSCETLVGDRKKDDFGYASGDQCEVDIAVDALNPEVVFSKTKAFEQSAWEAYESPKPERKQFGGGSNTWRNKGGRRRKHDVLVEMHLNKIKFQHETYPESTEQASRVVVVINNIEIRDRLVTSPFNKMLYLYTSPSRPRQSHANMVMLKAVHLRPDPQLSSIEECCLKISLLPIRLNVDQDSVLFLYQFFTDQIGKSDSDDEDSGTSSTKPPSHTPSVESLPVMTINMHENENGLPNEDENQANLLMFGDEQSGYDDSESTCSKDPSIDSTKPSTPVYFRQVIFSPDVPIRLDYQGKRVDMTHGPLAGLLMGLAQLNCSEIRLKRINHRYGILGMDKLAAFLLNEWASDIKKNQLPSLLGGVGPMYSFVQLFQGVRDLFWLPIEQYQKDGRIAKGLQRGANAFSTSAALAALELTNRFVKIVQGAAEITYDMVSPGPSVTQKRQQRHSSKKKKRYTQPGDIREGMTNAYHVVKEGLGDTAQTIVHVASKEHEQKGMSGAVGGVLRQIPPTVVRPIILMAEATTNVIDGFRSQLEPEFKKEAEEKWKESS